MDIKSKAAADTGRLHLKDANDEPLMDGDKPVIAIIYGPGTKQYRKAQNAQSNHLVKRLQKGKKNETSLEERAEQDAEFLTAITAGFENLEYDGQPVNGPDSTRRLYLDTSLGFIADQVTRFASDWANF